ncbi:MAG TPA: tRNA 2-thiouridine(34) synthase MnmA [Candidatus Saccharimonadales bacterium]|nr:tRNA 2-thiouridine(34) synthase MnmA [Candidatus Saccharimonadales bacterium]
MALKIYVGMSGGVDSSLSAALLKAQGYAVTGVYMKNWTQDLPGMKCPWADDLADAKRVAVQLGIPFKVFDFQKEYRQKVVDYMIAEYKAGRTPNPDIMCNQEVKFKLFLQTALADGADMIATGHYARVHHPAGPAPQVPSHSSSPSTAPGEREALPPGHPRLPLHELPFANGQPHNSEAPSGAEGGYTTRMEQSEYEWEGALSDEARGVTSLMMPADAAKDQTYFLYRITEEALSKTLFPLGNMTKPEVRAKAAELGLATAAKKDSQGICFVGQVGIKDFLSQYVTSQPGDIIDKKIGKVIGQHDGAIFYTFGQRHGLGVGGGLPYYVVGKDMAKNTVYVTTDLNDDSLWRDRLRLEHLHWINDAPAPGKTYQARTRYRAQLVDCMLDSKGVLTLAEPERAITPGQSAVLYDGDRVLGGGIVAEALAAEPK